MPTCAAWVLWAASWVLAAAEGVEEEVARGGERGERGVGRWPAEVDR